MPLLISEISDHKLDTLSHEQLKNLIRDCRQEARAVEAKAEAVKKLADKIDGSNNGYVFSPSLAEIETAKENPGKFRMQKTQGFTGWTIYLK